MPSPRYLPLLAALIALPAGATDAPSWVSLGPDGRELSWPLPPSGELLRVCTCGNNAYGERLCHCTQPAATLEETLRTPIALDVQSRRNLPASAPVPRPRLRYAGQPSAMVQP
ncbi:MAG TPA: hypothetical protein PKY40_12085 [Burkholderiaceae bacterium]|nr:hypothetical protein [Burkholderiaceae bacterium]